MSLTLVNASTSLDPSIVIVSLPPGLSLEQFRHLEYTIGQLLVTLAELTLSYPRRVSHDCHHQCCSIWHFGMGLVSKLLLKRYIDS